MKSFPRNKETYTGSFLVLRRRRRFLLMLAIVVSVTLFITLGIRMGKSGILTKMNTGHEVPKQKIISDWEAKKWDDVRTEAVFSLTVQPLDAFYLSFRGLSAYYKGMDLPEGDDRTGFLDEAVMSLRKAITTKMEMPKAQVEYVLGKAYFAKGEYYFDEAVKYLELSVASGYIGVDTWEYLALAYVGLGEKTQAVKSFELALNWSRTDLLLLSAAKAYLDFGQQIKAEALLLELLASGKDDLAKENGRFMMGDIYKSRANLSKAEEQYSLILLKDPSSSEAHYRIGIIYQIMGNSIKARSEWRKAVALDPMHAESRQKLAEKL